MEEIATDIYTFAELQKNGFTYVAYFESHSHAQNKGDKR